MVTSGTWRYSLGFSTNDRNQCLTWNYTRLTGVRHPLLCIVSFINTSWDCVNQSRAWFLTCTAPTSTSCPSIPFPGTTDKHPVFQWLIQEGLIVSPASSCFFTLGRLKHLLHTSNFFLVLNLLVSAQKNWHILLLSVATPYCIYGGLDAKGSVISHNMGGRKLETGETHVLILNEPTVPNPLTLCARGNPAGKVN